MESENLLSISESAARASVTEDTLRQYVKLGFLNPQRKNDELYFVAEELNTLFGPRMRPVERRTESVAAQPNMPDKFQSLKEAIHVSGTTVTPLEPQVSEADDEGGAFVQKNWRFARYNSQPSLNRETLSALLGRNDEERVSTSEAVGSLPFTNRNAGGEYHELVALNRRMQEEVRMLRDERDWLRLRLEKLEARAERDQMLLLSESENVRGLVAANGPRRSLWNMALPWFKNFTDGSKTGR